MQGHAAEADIWALGVCFYEFVTGLPPFNDDTPDLIFHHILHHEIEWPEGDDFKKSKTIHHQSRDEGFIAGLHVVSPIFS